MKATLLVNGVERTVQAAPEMPLLWVLRDRLGLKGAKFGCGIGRCGACTVHLDGEPLAACVVTLSAAAGRRVTTIEGLSDDGGHPVQRAWLAEQVAQCGYCQPGQIMAAAALLQRSPEPGDAEIARAMGAVLCRCGTYQRIGRAVRHAARLLREES
ncbi:MAG: (2Fe-2S)-binding protein [Gammaproteobacteria bacterium]|nr:(2Fe-2S)-binding protein [Gammaproteobacteria bacterium]